MALKETKRKNKITFYFDSDTEELEEFGVVEYRVQIQRDGIDIMQEYPKEKIRSSAACEILVSSKIKLDLEGLNEII
jgi:hypothetical protein